MNQPGITEQETITWKNDFAVIRSYLRGRTQHVRFERSTTQNTILAISTIHHDVMQNGKLNPAVATRLSKASRDLPAIHFRIQANRLEAYSALTTSQCSLPDSDHPRFDETARRMVIYLAHAADHLEFALGKGKDEF